MSRTERMMLRIAEPRARLPTLFSPACTWHQISDDNLNTASSHVGQLYFMEVRVPTPPLLVLLLLLLQFEAMSLAAVALHATNFRPVGYANGHDEWTTVHGMNAWKGQAQALGIAAGLIVSRQWCQAC